MIIDNIENFDKYILLNKNFKTVKDFIENNKISTLELGRHEINGNDLYVNVEEYMTKKIDASKPEAHRNYLDIQIVLSGEEQIGYANRKDAKTYSFYDENKDIEFLTARIDYIKATPEKFFIFFPQDVHHPSIAINNEPKKVKKAVFKIKIK